MEKTRVGTLAARMSSWYQWLVFVHTADPWEQVQRQSLALLLLLWTPLSAIVLLLTILAHGQEDIRPLLAAVVLSGVSWWLNRHSRLGAWLFVLMTATVAVIGLPTNIHEESIPLNVVYVFSLMIAALMFVPRDLMLVLVYQVAVSVLAVAIRGAVPYDVARVIVIHTPVLSAAAFLLVIGATQRLRLMRTVDQARKDLIESYDQTLEGWATATDLRDRETGNHSKRVADAARELAEAYGLKGQDLINLWRGALLHDVGKIGVPDAVLLKPGKLNDAEWEIMRRHPALAEQFLNQVSFLRDCMAIPRSHHERWDGSGYPHGLKGVDIPIEARIFAIIDVHDALTSDRPYRTASTDAAARLYIKEQAGTLFDPDLVDLFLILGLEKQRQLRTRVALAFAFEHTQ